MKQQKPKEVYILVKPKQQTVWQRLKLSWYSGYTVDRVYDYEQAKAEVKQRTKEFPDWEYKIEE